MLSSSRSGICTIEPYVRTDGSAVARGSIKGRIRRWIIDQSGVDLIEYMLLASFVGIVGWLGMQFIGINMNTSYRSWDETTQNIWEVPDPVSTP